jgi:hypothetical protein
MGKAIETMEKSMESHGNGKIHWKKSMEMSIPISESLCIHIYPIMTGATNSISHFVKLSCKLVVTVWRLIYPLSW